MSLNRVMHDPIPRQQRQSTRNVWNLQRMSTWYGIPQPVYMLAVTTGLVTPPHLDTIFVTHIPMRDLLVVANLVCHILSSRALGVKC